MELSSALMPVLLSSSCSELIVKCRLPPCTVQTLMHDRQTCLQTSSLRSGASANARSCRKRTHATLPQTERIAMATPLPSPAQLTKQEPPEQLPRTAKMNGGRSIRRHQDQSD
jgi:hypothetical protein